MSDISETFPMDFIGAARSEGEPAIIYISSDEEEAMDSNCGWSVDDLYLSSEDESDEIRLMAKCVERQLAEPISIPSTSAGQKQIRPVTPRPNVPPFPTFGEKYFNLARGNGPVSRDNRIKSNHPINICRNLVPQVDTPLSPPEQDRGLQYPCEPHDDSPSSMNTSMEAVASHFDDMVLAEPPPLVNYSDCVVCGKSVRQIQEETVNEYLDRTVTVGETLAETQARRRAFLDGMNANAFLLMPGGVSRAAACDGNWYSVGYNYNTLPGTLPMN